MTEDPAVRKSDWNPWAAGSRGVEVMRLERELAETRARERRARHEVAEMRERFERLLDASKRFTRTLSYRRRQLLTSRQHLLIHHTIDDILAEAAGLEDAAAGVLETLGKNLGWQVTVLWVAGEETLRCVEVWHKPNAAPDGFEEARLRTSYVRGEGLPGIAWAENRPVWASELPQEGRFVGEADSPEGGLRSVLAFPLTDGGRPRGIIELLGSEVLHRDEELHYALWLVGRRIGQFVDRRRDQEELREAEEQLRLATEAGRVGLLDWDVLADERRCSGAMAEIYGYPPGEFNLSYEEFLERVHPDDRGRVRSTLDAAVASGAPYELEFRIVRPAGDIRWVHAKGRVHRDEKGVFARMLGVSLDVTERKQAEQEREQLHSLEVTAHAEAAERERISRELHDRVAHSMGVAHQSLQLYEALAEKDPVRAHSKLHTAKEMTKTALEQTRNLSMELRRPETQNGLVPALQDLLEVAVPDDIITELSTSGAESRLSDHQRGQLYLILREAVRNAVRHSGCRRLTVGLDITSENVSGYVEDDGCDFEGNGGTRGGLGLRSIRERAALLEGTAEMYSSQKGGAGVQVRLPLRNGVG
ncbi:MAG TPA: PAS domain-containing protein [Rubrobacter sp.]|nr:PAS domain-containing protein [Rubrobacter sp.]